MKKVSLNTIGSFVHSRAMEKLVNGDGEGYWQCLHMTLDEDPGLKALYSGVTGTVNGPEIPPPSSSKQATSQAAGLELDKLAKSYAKQFECSYEVALKQVLKARQDLAKTYAQT